MSVPLNLMVAVCENMGIGKNGNLPWRLKSEMEYFTRMTSKCKDTGKKNIVVMGRKTWDSIPPKFKPLKNRINFVLSKSDLDVKDYSDVYHFKNLDAVLEKLEDNSFKENYEKVWVIGGSQIYDLCMQTKNFYRLYITYILKNYDCDTFFPQLPDNLDKVVDPDVPQEQQEESDVKFVYTVYENCNFKKV